MSRATPFASGVGSSSWADDDDVDVPIAKPEQHEQHEQEPIEEEHHDDEYPEHRDDRHDDGRGYSEDRRERGDDRRGGYERPKNPVPDQPPFKVYVGNLPFRMNEDDLANFFGPRDIADIRIPRNEEDRPKGFAYVEFATRDALVAALELDGRLAGGRAIRVDVAIERERKPRQRDNFFERRSDRPGRDNGERDSRGPREPREPREPLESRAPRERQRLTLLPRTTSSEQDATPSKKASIFGNAKPRDETAYQERKERERKERERKAAEAKEAKAKAKQAREERGKQGNASDNTKTTQVPRSGRSGPRTHEDRSAPRDLAPPAERTHAKHEEPRAKPLQTATKAKSATKVQNVFDLLNDDDDSDSD